jgi:DNA-directed RNA polymerase subunit alpha
MTDYNIILPSKPRIVKEDDRKGTYEIDNLYPGYGHTLGNSLRRIILSSLPGAAITSVKIEGVSHEFSTVEGVKEDVVLILLNLKKLRFKLLTDEPQTVTLSVKGEKEVTAADIKVHLFAYYQELKDRYRNHYRKRSRLRSSRCTPERKS